MSFVNSVASDRVEVETRLLIVNADDFGLTDGVNAGIIGAHCFGAVRSASLMATTPGFEDAVSLARRYPTLDLGVHLALTSVRPALAPERIPSLAPEGNRFSPLGTWLRRLATGRVNAHELHLELRAQLERILARGLPITHLDSHHHVHVFEPVATVVGELAREFGIPFVRRSGAQPPVTLAAPPVLLKRILLGWAGHRSAPAFRGTSRVKGLRGMPFPGSARAWRRVLHTLPPGVTELMCHPGLNDQTVTGLDTMVAARETELRWLCSRPLERLIVESGIQLTSFAEIQPGKQ